MIDKRENNKKSRSTGSNFNANSFLEKENSSSTVTHKQRLSSASFYPLAQSDIDKLQTLCSQEFSSNAINEILQSLSAKLPNHSFPHKAAFIKYMCKALAHKMRDVVKISNESFRIRSNTSKNQTIKQQKEAFLNKIEESTDTTTAAQLSRKLASILPPDLAYDFLLVAKFPLHAMSSDLKISLQKSIDLNKSQCGVILEQVQSVYGSSVSSLKFIVKNPAPPTLSLSSTTSSASNNASEMFPGVWGRIRTGLIKTCGEGIDHKWFSKLKVNVDEERGEIKLQAPNGFVRDWIQQNYQHLLERFCNKENYRLMEVTV